MKKELIESDSYVKARRLPRIRTFNKVYRTHATSDLLI